MPHKTVDGSLTPEDALVLICCSRSILGHFPLKPLRKLHHYTIHLSLNKSLTFSPARVALLDFALSPVLYPTIHHQKVVGYYSRQN